MYSDPKTTLQNIYQHKTTTHYKLLQLSGSWVKERCYFSSGQVFHLQKHILFIPS